MPDKKELDALAHFKAHNEFKDWLNKNGCYYGQMHSQEFKSFVNRYDSKVEGLETYRDALRDKTLPRIGDKSDEAASTAEAALKEAEGAMEASVGAHKRVDGIWWKIGIVILGGILTGNGLMFIVGNRYLENAQEVTEKRAEDIAAEMRDVLKKTLEEAKDLPRGANDD